jgi:hypothetical protein
MLPVALLTVFSLNLLSKDVVIKNMQNLSFNCCFILV